MFNSKVSRRQFLQSSLGFMALAGLSKNITAMPAMPKLIPNKASPNFKPDVELELWCKQNHVPILQGKETQVFQYSARLLKGAENTITEIAGSYLGPIIRLQQGQKVRIHFHNALSEPTVTHWHGLHVPANMDGHPQYAIDSGEVLVYEFEVLNRASLTIYHPHPHNATASQVYFGLAGALIVNDTEEQALELPSGEYELPIVIQDRLFDSQNQWIYARNMHERMTGFYGNRILVNGHADFSCEVDSRAYRLRVLNGSNARIYKLAWDDGTPLTVIGCDGGLLAQPETKPYVMLAPGERLDVWADFSGRAVGSQLTLRSLAFSGALPKMGMMMQNQNGLPVGSDYAIFTAKVTRKVSDSPKLPTQLSKQPVGYNLDATNNPNKALPITISEGHMSMLLNGQSYTFNNPQDNERVKVGSTLLVEIAHAHQNGGMGMGRMRGGMGMMNMAMAHPIHLHGQSFSILSRSIDANSADDYATVREGFINSGLKDTVLVMPNETVRLIKPFHDFKGLFMFHCHNLEHEDMGMMREFLVE